GVQENTASTIEYIFQNCLKSLGELEFRGGNPPAEKLSIFQFLCFVKYNFVLINHEDLRYIPFLCENTCKSYIHPHPHPSSGFYIPSASSQNIYQFVKENKTWEEAQDHCIFKMNSVLAPIYNKENVTPTEGYTDRAWIGLYEELSNWTWVTGLNKTRLWYWLETGENNIFASWQKGQPDNLSRGTRLMSSSRCGSISNILSLIFLHRITIVLEP
uniref:C-type lectin domain-containing protein n=1 Tax=Lates calcarifer TaxID=8187 RepID=A0A4W6G667_LATCA